MDTDGVGVSSQFCRTPLDQVSRQRDESPVLMGSYSGGGQRCVNWRQSDIMGIRLLSTGLSQHKSSALARPFWRSRDPRALGALGTEGRWQSPKTG